MNKAFSGLVLDPGDHHIELNYVSPGFKSGAFVTFAAFGISIGIHLYNRKRKKSANLHGINYREMS